MRCCPLLLTLLVCLPAIAGAQSELSVVLGYRGGDASFLVEGDAPDVACLVPPCVVSGARTPEGASWGVVLDVPIAAGWMFEALLNRQEGDLRLAAAPPVASGRLASESFDLSILQVGVLRRWGAGRLAPFGVAGAGVARVSSSAGVLSPPVGPGDVGRELGSADGLAASLGGGARWEIDPRWALRFEARAYWIDLPSGLGGELVQVEVSVGLSARL